MKNIIIISVSNPIGIGVHSQLEYQKKKKKVRFFKTNFCK
jgi:hypothetical protein